MTKPLFCLETPPPSCVYEIALELLENSNQTCWHEAYSYLENLSVIFFFFPWKAFILQAISKEKHSFTPLYRNINKNVMLMLQTIAPAMNLKNRRKKKILFRFSSFSLINQSHPRVFTALFFYRLCC